MMIVFALIFSFIITYLITPLVVKFALKFNLVDDAIKRFHPAHTHTGVVPRAGGLSVYIGIILTILIYVELTPVVIGIIISTTLLLISGLMDDKKDINPYFRLTINCIAVLIIILSGVKVSYISNPLNSGVINLDTEIINIQFIGRIIEIPIWSSFIAFLWILWNVNSIGWSAGVEGQMPGFVAIAAFTIGILSLRFHIFDPAQKISTILSFIVAGSFAGFLPWNFYPQKIMPGYSGKTIAGLFLGVLSILSYGKVGTALLVLGIPMLDATYTLIRRLSQGNSPVWADRYHLHHLLIDRGWGKRRIALFYWVVSAILGWVSLTVTRQQKIFVMLLLIVCFGGFLLWLKYFTQLSNQSDRDNG